MLVQLVRTSKNFLSCGNLLDHVVGGMIGLWGRSTYLLFLLTPRWSQGSRGVTLSWLVTVPSEVTRAPIVEPRVAQPCSLQSLRWRRLLRVDWRTWSYLLRCTVAPLLLLQKRTTRLAYMHNVDQAVLGRSAPEGPGVALLPFFSSLVARTTSSCWMVPLMSWLKVQL
jgi:hypothetical protein